MGQWSRYTFSGGSVHPHASLTYYRPCWLPASALSDTIEVNWREPMQKTIPTDYSTLKEYQAIVESLAVKPESYTKPIRIYCDVDGVVMPFIAGQEEYDRLDGKNEIVTYEHVYADYLITEDSTKTNTTVFAYNKFVAEKLAEWSKRDDVDFVWLTAWKHNAPFALDEILGVESVGHLPWNLRRSDYTHKGKGHAIRNEQEENPSQFVWIDDFANKVNDYYEPGLDYFSSVDYIIEDDDDDTAEGIRTVSHRIHPDRYLAITTESYSGLTIPELTRIDEWIEEQKRTGYGQRV
jgi:hypothetical protein